MFKSEQQKKKKQYEEQNSMYASWTRDVKENERKEDDQNKKRETIELSAYVVLYIAKNLTILFYQESQVHWTKPLEWNGNCKRSPQPLLPLCTKLTKTNKTQAICTTRTFVLYITHL